MTCTFLKWAGGKTFLSKKILDILPKDINNYHEPFLGSGAIFFSLMENNRIKGKSFLSDYNAELIITYNAIKDTPNEVLQCLKEYTFEYRRKSSKDLKLAEEYYYYVRDIPIEMLYNPGIAARMIFLNKTCFNGLYRVNKSGKFNVPFGKRVNPKIYSKEDILTANNYLNNSSIGAIDFRNTIKNISKGDTIYFDPPYIPVKLTSFKAYTNKGFSEKDHIDLRDLALKLKNSDVNILLSNSDTELTRSLYNNFNIEEVSNIRHINSDKDGRKQIKELLIS